MTIFWSRRARAAILLDVLELFVRRRADHAQLTGGQDRLDQRRQVHRAAGGGAGADGGVNLVDEEDGHRPLRERMDDGLEALLEVAAEARAREQRAGVEREHLGAFEQIRNVVSEQPRRQPLGERRLADAGVADEHRVVLAPAAEDLHGPLQLVGAPDQRIELARLGARGQVGGVGGQRIARGGAAAVADAGLRVRRLTTLGPGRRRRRHLRLAVGDVLEHVEARDALRRQELRRVRPVLLQRRGDDVAGVHFLPARALHVQHRRLQHAPERQRLLRLLLLAARELFDRFVQILVEIAAQLRHVGAAGREDPLAFGIVRERVEEVLEREVRVTPRGRLTVRDGQDDFECWAEHFLVLRWGPTPSACHRSLPLATILAAMGCSHLRSIPVPSTAPVIARSRSRRLLPLPGCLVGLTSKTPESGLLSPVLSILSSVF